MSRLGPQQKSILQMLHRLRAEQAQIEAPPGFPVGLPFGGGGTAGFGASFSRSLRLLEGRGLVLCQYLGGEGQESGGDRSSGRGRQPGTPFVSLSPLGIEVAKRLPVPASCHDLEDDSPSRPVRHRSPGGASVYRSSIPKGAREKVTRRFEGKKVRAEYFVGRKKVGERIFFGTGEVAKKLGFRK